MATSFQEQQRFTQWWLWLMLVLITCIPFYGIYQQIIVGTPFGNNPMSNLGLIIFAIAMVGMLLFFWNMQLKTTIDAQRIKIRFSPFVNRSISWDEIETAEIINYGFVGGWGIRFSGKYGIVYNTSGNQGLFIILKNGNKLCLGTQQPKALQKAVQQYFK